MTERNQLVPQIRTEVYETKTYISWWWA